MLGISLKTLYNRLAVYKSEDAADPRKRRIAAENDDERRDAA
jgi:hypothetical protein